MRDWKYLKYDLQDQWERITEKLNLPRQWLNQQDPKIMFGIAAFCAVIFIAVGIGQFRTASKTPTSNNTGKAWFYDLNTNKLFTAAAAIPPIEAPSGPLPNGDPAGVTAHVFTFAAEPNDPNHFIAYLETYTPQGKEQLTKLLKSKGRNTNESLKDWDNGRLIRTPDAKEWLPANSDQAREIIIKALSLNKTGARPQPLSPN